MNKRLYVTLTLTLFLFSMPIFGQEVSSESPPLAEALPTPRLDLSSPQKTMRTFVEAMSAVGSGKPEKIMDAQACLNLEDIPEAEREARSLDLCRKLFEILNSFTFKVDAIPDKVDRPFYQFHLGKEKEVQILFTRGKDNNWQFSYSRTLKKAEEALEKIAKAAAEKTPTELAIDAELSSPRETMKIFLDSMADFETGGKEKALRTLDLSIFEAQVRKEIGRERALMLKFIIDRHKYVDLVEVPNDSSGNPYVHISDKVGSIIIERVAVNETASQAWKFSGKSLENLPNLYEIYKYRPLAKGVKSTVQVPLSIRMKDFFQRHLPLLRQRDFLLENWQWLGLILVIALGIILAQTAGFLVIRAIRKIFTRRQFTLDAGVEDKFLSPFNLAITAWLWWVGLGFLSLPAKVLFILLVSAKIVAGFAGIVAAYRLIDVGGDFGLKHAALTENKFDDLLVPLVTRTLKVFSIAIGLVFLSDVLELDLNKILAGLGLGGLAFALAAKDTVANLFGSLTILLDRPFQIGDWVTIGDVDGTVETVGVRSTRVRTFYNSLISVPNSTLTSATIDNWGARTYRRITSDLSIAYDTPPGKIDAFCEGIREIIRKHPYTRKDYFHVYLNKFGPASLDIMLYCFVKTPDWSTELREKHRLYIDIIRLAQNLKVEFAFPTQTLYLRKEEIPIHENVPPDFETSNKIGRSEADGIITSSLGPDGHIPPPVTFT